MADVAELMNHKNIFCNRIVSLPKPIEHCFTIEKLKIKGSGLWADWENEPGIYVFVQNERVQYVGRATRNVTLGSRVFNQMNASGDPKWDHVINDDNTKIYLFVWDREDWHWLAALELFLIDKLNKPPFNKRIG